MKHLIRRLERLEQARLVQTSGPALWSANRDAVEQCALGFMSFEDGNLFRLAMKDVPSQQELIAKHESVWNRWSAAFERAFETVPARYGMCLPDWFGQD